MSTQKRRKLDTATEQPAVSAFARLRRLQSRQVPAAQSDQEHQSVETKPQDQDDQDVTIETTGSQPDQVIRSKRTRKPVTRTANAGTLPNTNGSSTSVEAPPSPDEEVNIPDRIAKDASQNGPNGLQLATRFQPSRVPSINLSTFHLTKSNSQVKAGGKQLLRLSGGERIVILGSYGIRVTSGEVTIHGAVLGPSEKTLWVHAPSCYALPVVRCSDETVIEIDSYAEADGLRSLQSLSPLFRQLWNEQTEPVAQDKRKQKQASPTFEILYSSSEIVQKRVLHTLVSPPEWNREADKIAVASRAGPISIMVTGPKSSGKSTFGKILVNQLLTSVTSDGQVRHAAGVAVLDLDPGQPEYGVPGQVSLTQLTEPVLSPSFCRPLSRAGMVTIRAHTLASTTPSTDPALYEAAAIDLMNHYRNRLSNCPLIINTPGWVQGSGLDILTALIEKLRPSEVVFMSQTGPMDVVETLGQACKSISFSQLPSQTTQGASRTAADLRTMQTMSYFHAELKSPKDQAKQSCWSPEPIAGVAPWMVKYTGSEPGILGVMFYDYQSPPELVAETINGTVVAIVEVENGMALYDATDSQEEVEISSGTNMDLDEKDRAVRAQLSNELGTTPEGIPFVQEMAASLNPRYSLCLGLALVRGIDVSAGTLHLLTPISTEVIEGINERGGEIVLVGGKFDPPSWAYTEDMYNQSKGNDNDVEDKAMAVDKDGSAGEGEDVEDLDGPSETASAPWIEILKGNQKRSGKIWRVRRDLGRRTAE